METIIQVISTKAAHCIFMMVVCIGQVATFNSNFPKFFIFTIVQITYSLRDGNWLPAESRSPENTSPSPWASKEQLAKKIIGSHLPTGFLHWMLIRDKANLSLSVVIILEDVAQRLAKFFHSQYLTPSQPPGALSC